MNKKLIRIFSPITIAVFAILDLAVIYFGYQAITKFMASISPITIFFVAVEIGAIILAILVTKEIFSNGVAFYDDEMEFTGLDENNVIEYGRVKSIKIFKDNAASLVKNFNDRHTIVYITFNDDDKLSVDLGLTTDKLVKELTAELNTRLDAADISAEIKTKPDFKSKNNDDKDEESTD